VGNRAFLVRKRDDIAVGPVLCYHGLENEMVSTATGMIMVEKDQSFFCHRCD
jgi:hypothetical protein